MPGQTQVRKPRSRTQPLPKKISLIEARQVVLTSQGLARPNQFGLGLPAVRRAIETLGYIQIDTISVVERAHHHVLWSRVRDYSPLSLGKLLKQKEIFEYWSHAASYLPMSDFRFSLPRNICMRRVNVIGEQTLER